MADIDDTAVAPSPDPAGRDDLTNAAARRPATSSAAPLWQRIAGGAAIAGVVGLCGALGFAVGKMGRGEAPSVSVQEATTQLAAAPAAAPARADFGGTPAPADVRSLADWVVAHGDHGRRAFAVVDKTDPSVYVFSPDGRLLGKAPALVGLAVGDESVPGIGERPIHQVRPHERTTPAGRFVTAPGTNLTGEEVIWVDYGAAVSMHSVRALVAEERRLERLASPVAAEHRISYGCINLPHEFFKSVAQPAFSQPGGVIYVLPETRPWQTIVVAPRTESLASR